MGFLGPKNDKKIQKSSKNDIFANFKVDLQSNKGEIQKSASGRFCGPGPGIRPRYQMESCLNLLGGDTENV